MARRRIFNLENLFDRAKALNFANPVNDGRIKRGSRMRFFLGSIETAACILLLASCTQRTAHPIIHILDTCPEEDPAYDQIRSDFEIRRNGILVPDVPCSGPISQIPADQYSDELIAFQTLRMIYYMEGGRSGHLPWTSDTMYDWMKSKMVGIDIRDDAEYANCCESINGRLYFVILPQPVAGRSLYKEWLPISDMIALFAHEIRHLDGFPHLRCCPGQDPSVGGDACDETYDEANLSPYGLQRWLHKSWLAGEINVGFSCLDDSRVQEIAMGHLSRANSSTIRFCNSPPPVLTLPLKPGGGCMANVYDARVDRTR